MMKLQQQSVLCALILGAGIQSVSLLQLKEKISSSI